MARMRFGGGPQDVYLFEDTDGDLHAGGGFNALMYDGEDLLAAPVTDLLDEDGNPATYITTSDGTDGRAAGQLPVFWGPDNVFELWTAINDAPRVLLTPTNLGTYLGPTKDQVDELVGSGNPNPLNIAFSALVGVDGESLDTAGVGSAVVKLIDGTYGAAGAPIPLSDTLWVAASNAPDSFDPAPYVCDGTDDHVQIQAALDNAFGMRVGLSPGLFNIGAPITVVGLDDATENLAVYLSGSGATSTSLVAASGIGSVINMSAGVSAHISDLSIVVTGATRGILTEKTTTPGAEIRGWYNGSIRRVNVFGPNNGTSTVAGISLKSSLQFSVEDVLIHGTLMGIEITSDDAAIVAGQGNITRCHASVIGANAIGYQMTANSGKIKFVTFDNCSAVVDPVYSNTHAWRMQTPSGEIGSIRLNNATTKGFYRSIFADTLVYEVRADFGYAQLKSGGQFSSLSGFANVITVSELALDAGVTAAATMDNNSSGLLTNEYDIHLYTSTGTVTAQLTGSVVTRGIVEGGATVPATLKRYPGQTRRTAGPWSTAGSLAGKVGAGTFSWYNDSGLPVFIRSVRATVGTAPTGASIIVDLNLNGTTVFTTQANRPTIAISGTSSGLVTNMNVVEVPNGGRLSVDIDQVGSTVAGSDLIVLVEVA